MDYFKAQEDYMEALAEEVTHWEPKRIIEELDVLSRLSDSIHESILEDIVTHLEETLRTECVVHLKSMLE